MTKLFEEYENLRIITKNPNSLIGRKFYWSGHNGQKVERKQINEFQIHKVISNSPYYPEASPINPYCEYQYLHHGPTYYANRPLKEILEGATEFID